MFWKRLPRSAFSASLVLALLTVAAPPVRVAEPAVGEERWYSVLLQDQPVGWMHTRVSRSADRVETTEEVRISVSRGSDTLEVRLENDFTETSGGKPVEARSRQRLGASEVSQLLRFGDQSVELVVTQGTRTQVRTFPPPAPGWLTPQGVRRHVEEQIRRGSREISFRAVDPAAGPAPYETTMRLVGEETVEVMGRVVPSLRWETSTTLLPGLASTEHTDGEGTPLRSTLPLLPGLPLTVVAADRELATSRKGAPEILAATLVEPKGRIEDPRRLRRAVYRLASLRDSEGGGNQPAAPPLSLPHSGSQRTEPAGGGTVRVTVDPSGTPPPDRDPPKDEDRRASAVIDSDDPAVRGLVDRVLSGLPRETPRPQVAEALRKFVFRYVQTKDLSVGFATAGETARTAQGDCTEHAVLLAALLRAAGIPSRVASGLIYVDRFQGREGVFGYHMWTQAWLETEDTGGRWADLDATLGGAAFDAAHIALAVSSMAEGTYVNDLVKLTPLIGRLEIEIEEPPGPSGR